MYPHDIVSAYCKCDTICNCKQFWEGNEPPFKEPTFETRMNIPLTGQQIEIDTNRYILLSNKDIISLQGHYAGRIIGYCQPYALLLWNGNVRHNAYIIKYI